MAGNPNVVQGVLNRVRGSITVPDNTQLNVTAAFLGRAAISLTFEGTATTTLPTMAGTVQSAQPYQMATITINLLKSQGLAQVYETQRQTISTIGDVVVKGDASTLQDYYINNCAIQTVRELNFSGEDPGYVVTVTGYYSVNNNIWNLV